MNSGTLANDEREGESEGGSGAGPYRDWDIHGVFTSRMETDSRRHNLGLACIYVRSRRIAIG